MKKGRLFAKKELEELGERTKDLLLKAIEAGDQDKAKMLARRMYGELMAMHDIEVKMLTAALSFIGRRYGDATLHQALHEVLGSWVRQTARAYARVEDPRRRAEMLAYGLKGHGGALKIEEDADKFTLTMEPCGSGGRLVLEGCYGPPTNFYRVKKPQMMTYGKKDFPVYCAHCIFHEIVGIEETGVPLFVLLPPEKPGEEPCHMLLYKDPRTIPEEYYERAGKKKPRW